MRRSPRRSPRGCAPPTSSPKAPRSSAPRRWARRSSARLERLGGLKPLNLSGKRGWRPTPALSRNPAAVISRTVSSRASSTSICTIAAIVAQCAGHAGEHFALVALDVDLDCEGLAGERNEIVEAHDLDIIALPGPVPPGGLDDLREADVALRSGHQPQSPGAAPSATGWISHDWRRASR